MDKKTTGTYCYNCYSALYADVQVYWFVYWEVHR